MRVLLLVLLLLASTHAHAQGTYFQHGFNSPFFAIGYQDKRTLNFKYEVGHKQEYAYGTTMIGIEPQSRDLYMSLFLGPAVSNKGYNTVCDISGGLRDQDLNMGLSIGYKILDSALLYLQLQVPY